MTDPAHTDRIIEQGKALVRAIGALGTIEPSGPFEHALGGHGDAVTGGKTTAPACNTQAGVLVP
jgi:hypothetical protein